MSDDSSKTNSPRTRRRMLQGLLAAGMATSLVPGTRASADVPPGGSQASSLRNPLLWAVAWKQTAAEYAALCYQAFNLARLQIDLALSRQSAAGFRKTALRRCPVPWSFAITVTNGMSRCST